MLTTRPPKPLCFVSVMLHDGSIPVRGVVSDVYEQESEASCTLTTHSADVNSYFPLLFATIVDIVQIFLSTYCAEIFIIVFTNS
jgi:hypothetical protein